MSQPAEVAQQVPNPVVPAHNVVNPRDLGSILAELEGNSSDDGSDEEYHPSGQPKDDGDPKYQFDGGNGGN